MTGAAKGVGEFAMQSDHRLDARIERICQRGCRQVGKDIATLERGG